jgi:hypothetical protein
VVLLKEHLAVHYKKAHGIYNKGARVVLMDGYPPEPAWLEKKNPLYTGEEHPANTLEALADVQIENQFIKMIEDGHKIDPEWRLVVFRMLE